MDTTERLMWRDVWGLVVIVVSGLLLLIAMAALALATTPTFASYGIRIQQCDYASSAVRASIACMARGSRLASVTTDDVRMRFTATCADGWSASGTCMASTVEVMSE